MKIEINTHTIIKFHSTYNSVDELPKIGQFFLTILSKVFLNKPALIVTIAPDKRHSIGYEIAFSKEIKIEKSKFLINNVKSCSLPMLTEISQSEEFGRGLLLLMTRESDLLEGLEENLSYIHNNLGMENLLYEIVVCENDGKTLCVYNARSKEELASLIP